MIVQSTEVANTYAEAFKMSASRVIITAQNPGWAMTAAQSVTGFATSVIGCKCEAGIERELSENETPDLRPGVSVLLFAFSAKAVANRLIERIGQCVMTCPTTSCFNGLENAETTVAVGGKIRYFGDGFQASKRLNGRRLWRIPVMEGEFLIDDRFGVQEEAVGGGNLILLGKEVPATLKAAEAAVEAMRKVPGVILPFPGGLVRSGSKPGSKYKSLPASTNDAFCPTLRAKSPRSVLDAQVGCVLEVVIDGLDEASVAEAMRAGIHAAADNDLIEITAGNYGGNLGQYQIQLHGLIQSGQY